MKIPVGSYEWRRWGVDEPWKALPMSSLRYAIEQSWPSVDSGRLKVVWGSIHSDVYEFRHTDPLLDAAIKVTSIIEGQV